MGGGVVGLDIYRIFGAEIGSLIVFIVEIELCDGEVLVDTFVIALKVLRFGQFAMNGGAFGRIAIEVWGCRRVVRLVAAGTGA